MEDGDIAHLNEFLLLPEGYLHLWAPSPPLFEHPPPPLPKSPLAEEDHEGVQKAKETNPSFSSFLHFSKCSFFFVKLNGWWWGKPKGGSPLPDPPSSPFILELSGWKADPVIQFDDNHFHAWKQSAKLNLNGKSSGKGSESRAFWNPPHLSERDCLAKGGGKGN